MSATLTYTLLDVPPAEFGSTVRAFFAGGGKGLNVTVPHKEAAAPLSAELMPRAARAWRGTCSTITTYASPGAAYCCWAPVALHAVCSHRCWA